MLEVVFYQSNSDLLEKIERVSPPLIICPSPKIADHLRGLAPGLEVVTIAKWTADHLKKLGLVRFKKSQLMLKLAAVWKNYFPGESALLFSESFELFTELRSFTLDLELLKEFFKELDERVVKSILIFWTYLEQEKIIDEHLSYQKILESPDHRSMWFMGFKHMSGVQIDMLKTLGEKCDIHFFFPLAVFHETLPHDWIRWMVEKAPRGRESEEERQQVKVCPFPRGKANVVLQKFFNEYPTHDLLLATSSATLASYQEFRCEGAFFKTSEDLFSCEVEWLCGELEERLKAHGELALEELSVSFEAMKSTLADKGEYRKYKMVDLAKEALLSYGEFTATLDLFGLDILKLTLFLDAPRISLLSLEEKVHRNFFDVEDLFFRSSDRPLAVIATLNMGSFRSGEKILGEEMTRILKSIGPLKRAGLEFSFYKHEILSVLKGQDAVLLIEERLLDIDLAWRETLSTLDMQNIDLNLEYSIKEPRDYLSSKMRTGPFLQKRSSASRIQAFLDCPQKFYFTYIDKMDSRPAQRASLAPDELGNLEHKIIAAYFGSEVRSSNEVDLELHRQVCQSIFEAYLQGNGLVLTATKKAQSYGELMHYTGNGITFLKNLMQAKRGKSLRFEVSLGENPWGLNGSIDCIIEGDNGALSVLDFKRSGASVGSKKETLDFKKIQLWVYLLVLKDRGAEIESFGYINLSDLEDGKLFFDGQEAQGILSTSLEGARAVVEQALQDMQTMEVFRADPRDFKVCNYCPVELFCLKGGVG